jgi:hypothetical protein
VSKDDGSYEFYLERGKYDLLVSMIGYKTRVVTFYINNGDITENVTLEPDESASLSEVVIKAKLKDRAEDIIRQVIRNKETVLDAIGSYSCNAYIKAFQLDSNYTKKKEEDDSTQKEDPTATGFERMSLTEILVHVDRNTNGQIKEERRAVNKRGNMEVYFIIGPRW